MYVCRSMFQDPFLENKLGYETVFSIIYNGPAANKLTC